MPLKNSGIVFAFIAFEMPLPAFRVFGSESQSPHAGAAANRKQRAKAISVKAHTALLVFSLAFFVVPPVT
ncbi:hypothetical protein [Halochromatium glycolicum]|uniref:hypothetical protein n=1 Tax=Halochromatium glycolicum TaxID=85075 RepID=UPI001A916793|nr:hypothetical protein [Halochromatium glycolicum]